jgi:hypothetical protein
MTNEARQVFHHQVRALLLEKRPDWNKRIRFNPCRDAFDQSVSVRRLGTVYWLEYNSTPEENAKSLIYMFEDMERETLSARAQ